MTTPNPIEEIKAIQHRLGAEVGFDIHRVFAELRDLEKTSGRTYVHHAPRRVVDNRSTQARDRIKRSDEGESTVAVQ